ncbi:hypothetical protein C9413_16265 [Rhizobium sp. SEMIA 4085]|uniref:hypothetical protein n=1 Tax=Rhizobium sp. SEMIA 4085 TaxID=2137761 RepID=UPI0014780F0D|nr:hypothetical protein [Rhizobium sp. SEMIA 4085]NNH31002.1 hypothetical protein [Rhizobium sp. SEMIA 4085]
MNANVKIDLESASALWKDGSSIGVIATKYGVSRQTVGTSPLLQIHASDEERLGTGKELHELGVHQCRWPLNNGSPFLFCADATGGDLYFWHLMHRGYRVRKG